MKKRVETDDNLRLDKYLLNELSETRSKIQKLIDNSLILVNNKKVKASYIVKNGDEIEVLEEILDNSDIIPENIPLDIVYEDDDVLVVNKKSGMVVHPAVGNYSGTLVNALMYHFKTLSDINGELRPGIVHRIDADTSGLLLIAKNNKAHLSLASQLENKTVTRKYVALVNGVIKEETATIDAPIGRDLKNRKKMCVTDINSKSAITHIKVLERYNKATLIECVLETGRTHQIRVHMKYIKHSVINDPAYSSKIINKNFGQMLHAKVIGFNHPITNKYLEFSVEAPKEFYEILDMYKNDN